MYQANLSYNQLQKYMKYLIKINLLKTHKNGQEELYVITEKGLKFIEEFQKLLKLLE